MIEEIKAGWATVKVGSFVTKASDIDDLPIDWLKTFIFGLQNNVPITLFIEEEGSESYITTSSDMTYIISDGREHCEFHEFEDITVKILAKEFMADLIKYFEEWVKWNPFEEGKSEGERRSILESMMRELDTLI